MNDDLSRALAPSPTDRGPCKCGHAAKQHWYNEPEFYGDPVGGCEGRYCDCQTYRPLTQCY